MKNLSKVWYFYTFLEFSAICHNYRFTGKSEDGFSKSIPSYHG